MSFADDPDDEGGEFEVNIDPREDNLDRLGIDHADFEEALYAALDAQGESLETDGGDDVARTLEELPILIAGKTYRLGDLANVSIDEAGDDEEEYQGIL